VAEADVRGLVHGAIFTRGPKDLKSTAIFIGGSSVPAAEGLLAATRQAFFGPFRVSVMLDPNGCNTTAAAAVVKLVKAAGGDVRGRRAVVLAGTGPVGARAAGLLVRLGAQVTITSREAAHGASVARQIGARFKAEVEAASVRAPGERSSSRPSGAGRGPTGSCSCRRGAWAGRAGLRAGRRQRGAAARDRGHRGVRQGHRARRKAGVRRSRDRRAEDEGPQGGLARLFEQNDLVLDAEEIYDLAAAL
jgi:hypothetical protein